jgi:hypothetical protein
MAPQTMPPALRRFAEFLAANPSPTDVVAGKFYMVPCATHPDGTTWRFRTKRVPLLGTVHEDRDIVGFKPWHIHVDTRFLSFPKVNILTDPYSDMRVLGTPLSFSDFWFDEEKITRWGNANLSMRLMKARRAEPPEWLKGIARWMPALESSYADASAACGVCPHRQIPLSAGRDMGNGVRQCPGHGLCWDREGRMVRREVA